MKRKERREGKEGGLGFWELHGKGEGLLVHFVRLGAAGERKNIKASGREGLKIR